MYLCILISGLGFSLSTPSSTYMPPTHTVIRIHETPSRAPEGQWEAIVCYGDKDAQIRLTDPFSSAQEEELRWNIEDHPSVSPFEIERAARVSADLGSYGRALVNQLQSALAFVLGSTTNAVN